MMTIIVRNNCCDTLNKLYGWSVGVELVGFLLLKNIQEIDGSARKPTLVQDTGYLVEKTYHDIAPYVSAFRAYLMPQ